MADDKKVKIGIEIAADTAGATQAEQAMDRVVESTREATTATTRTDAASDAAAVSQRTMAEATDSAADAATTAAAKENALATAVADVGDEAADAATKLKTVEEKSVSAGTAGDAAAPKTRNMGNALLQLSRAADDAQYGIAGVVNNIEGIAMALGVGSGVAGIATLAALAVNQLFKSIGSQSEEAKAKADEVAKHMEEKAEALKSTLKSVANMSAAAQKAEWEDVLAESGRVYDRAVANAARLTAEVQRTIDKLALQREKMLEIQEAQATLEKTAISTSGASDSQKVQATAAVDKSLMITEAQAALDKYSDALDTATASMNQAKDNAEAASIRMVNAQNRMATAQEALAGAEEARKAVVEAQTKADAAKKEAATAKQQASSYFSGDEFMGADPAQAEANKKASVLETKSKEADTELAALTTALAKAKATAEQYSVTSAKTEESAAAKALDSATTAYTESIAQYNTAQDALDSATTAINAVLQRKGLTVDLTAAAAAYTADIQDPLNEVSTAMSQQTSDIKTSFSHMKDLLEGGITATEKADFIATVQKLKDAIGTSNTKATEALNQIVTLGTSHGKMIESLISTVSKLQTKADEMQTQINYLNSK